MPRSSARWSTRPTALLASLWLVGCGSDETLLPSGYAAAEEADAGSTLEREVSELYAEVIDVTQKNAAFMCECEVQGTTETVEECVYRTSPPTAPPIQECTRRILAADERSLEPLRCEADSRTRYLDCVEKSTCLDFDNQLNCQIDILLSANCPNVPWDLWAQNQVECLGQIPPKAFVCGDGTKISADWTCDGEADCPDASDEHVCQ